MNNRKNKMKKKKKNKNKSPQKVKIKVKKRILSNWKKIKIFKLPNLQIWILQIYNPRCSILSLQNIKKVLKNHLGKKYLFQKKNKENKEKNFLRGYGFRSFVLKYVKIVT